MTARLKLKFQRTNQIWLEGRERRAGTIPDHYAISNESEMTLAITRQVYASSQTGRNSDTPVRWTAPTCPSSVEYTLRLTVVNFASPKLLT